MDLHDDQTLLSTTPLLFFGCGGHARSVADVLLSKVPSAQLLFIDACARAGETLFGFPIVTECPQNPMPSFPALGDNAKRRLLWEAHPRRHWIQIISPSAHLGHLSQIGDGVFIGNRAHLGPQTQIGPNTIINTGAIVEHEVHVGAHCHIGPNAAISGRCQIGDNVFIGVGATVKDKICIGSDIVVGAGAVVVKDLVEPGVYVGSPARFLKKLF